VVVTEHLLAIASPDVFPNFWGVDTDAVDEPLGVIIQSDLDESVSSMVRA
jgi:hypothetical protein